MPFRRGTAEPAGASAGGATDPVSLVGRPWGRLFDGMATASSADALVELRDVTFGYGERAVLRQLSLSVPRGKVTALMGASGGGKTTVLRLIGGQQRAQQGQVRVAGQDVGTMSEQQLYAARRRMGMLFQFGALFTDLSVFDNVAFPLREHTALPEALIRDIVLMKLDAVGLRGARELMPSEISGGMARRVALARAIALDPDLVMYDEPFAGLDPISLGTAAEVRASSDPLIRQFVGVDLHGPVQFHYPGPTVEQDFGVEAGP